MFISWSYIWLHIICCLFVCYYIYTTNLYTSASTACDGAFSTSILHTTRHSIYYRTEKLTEASPHDARSESPCAGTKLLKQSYRKCSEVFRGTWTGCWSMGCTFRPETAEIYNEMSCWMCMFYLQIGVRHLVLGCTRFSFSKIVTILRVAKALPQILL